MPKRIVAALLCAIPASLPAQSLEPGEWEFNSTTSSPSLSKPHSLTIKQCVKKEDADNPERWMGRQAEKRDCKFTQQKSGADTISWQVSCPKSSMRGSGTARIDGRSLESDMQMSGNVHGRSFEMRTRMTGRRLGPCKS